MPEIVEQVLAILLPAAATLLAGWFGILGAQMKAKYNEKINTQMKKDLVNETVQYVQQVYQTLGGPEKLQKAIEQASALLTEKGIPVSEAELNMLIESSVYGLKQGMNEVPTTITTAGLLQIEPTTATEESTLTTSSK